MARYAIERRSWKGLTAAGVLESQPDGQKWEGAGGPVCDTVAEAKAILHKLQVGALAEYRMVTVGREGDVYRDAVAFGVQQCPIQGETIGGAHDQIDARAYWTAWFAGREASKALLQEARRVGVTDEQWEALRTVAADVAYD